MRTMTQTQSIDKIDYSQAVRNYQQYYQQGPGIAVFRGQRDQYGAGFGNFLGRMFRGIWDFVRPAAGAAASQAIRSAAEGVVSGAPIRDIAKSALAQSTGAAMHGLADETTKRIQGGGRKRRRKSVRKAAKRARKALKHKRRVYKKKSHKGKAHSKRQKKFFEHNF